MDLSKAKIKEAPAAAPASQVTESPPEEAKEVVCARCELPGTKPTKDGECDVCGAAWAEPVDDDFSIALDLLQSNLTFMEKLLKNRKALNKIGGNDEVNLRDLAMQTADFLDTYSEWDTETTSADGVADVINDAPTPAEIQEWIEDNQIGRGLTI